MQCKNFDIYVYVYTYTGFFEQKWPTLIYGISLAMNISSLFKQSASEHRSPKFAVKLRTTAIRGPHSAATNFTHSFHVDGDKAGAFPRAFFLLCGILPTMALMVVLMV